MIVLDKLNSAQQVERTKQWRRYRQLLERANAGGGELAKGEQGELAELLAALRLTTDDARRHADVLRNHQIATTKAALLVAAQDQQKALEQQVAEFTLRYQNAIAPLELEGARLAAAQQDLSGRISSLLWQAGKAEQIEAANPDLFSITITPPLDPPLKSAATMREEAARDEIRDKAQAVGAMFRDGGFGPGTMDEYKRPFYAAYELGLIDAPQNCRAEIEFDFPLWIARQIRSKSRTRDDLPPLAAKALDTAISDGLLDPKTLHLTAVAQHAKIHAAAGAELANALVTGEIKYVTK